MPASRSGASVSGSGVPASRSGASVSRAGVSASVSRASASGSVTSASGSKASASRPGASVSVSSPSVRELVASLSSGSYTSRRKTNNFFLMYSHILYQNMLRKQVFCGSLTCTYKMEKRPATLSWSYLIVIYVLRFSRT